jgi:tetratricopeptide (TPR) repeat protein
LDPELSLALVDLASLLYGEGDYPASMEAYQLALKQSPDLRSGLEGVARVSIAQRSFGQASEYLRRILRNNPNDAEAWLNLGDVAIYQGDELAARGHYTQAATIDPMATEIITQARMRLDDLSWLRERYQQKPVEP